MDAVGIIASAQLAAQEGGGDWWEADSVAHVDLANARAWSSSGDEAAAITDYIGTDPNGYSNYESANLVEGVGYRSPDQTPSNSGFSLAGDALTDAIAEIEGDGAVIVVKGSTSDTGANSRELILYLTDDGGSNVELSAKFDIALDGTDEGSFIADFVAFEAMAAEIGHGAHNLAYRVTGSRVAASMDGQAVVAYDNPDRTQPITGVHLVSRNHFVIEEVIVYASATKAEADLDELSAN